MVTINLDPIPLSALQHWAYYPRQCGSIYQEQVFEYNVHTARGQAVHHLVDEPGYEMQSGVKVERALPLWSERVGLIGKADLVEFHADSEVGVRMRSRSDAFRGVGTSLARGGRFGEGQPALLPHHRAA